MAKIPLAARLRPRELSEVCGQQHLLREGAVFRSFLENGILPNMIFYGPSGVGKTTMAGILAERSNLQLFQLNGTTASTADIRDVIGAIDTISGKSGILLYLDEIQYLNKKQQQSLLSFVEDGSVTLIASTTENPYFYIYNALLSRCTVFEFYPLQAEDVLAGLTRALEKLEKEEGVKADLEEGALPYLSAACGGDMRKALSSLELLWAAAPVSQGQPAGEKKKHISSEMVREVAQRSSMRYDKKEDVHYDLLSALQTSIRGSDANAACHYLACLLEAGDLLSPCRRLLVVACEDIGLAYPQAIPIVKSCVDTALQLGLPEARIPLADAAVLLATAPKSNTAYAALNEAAQDVKQGGYGDVPSFLKGTGYAGAESLGRGSGYIYTQNVPGRWAPQQYLPDGLKDAVYYRYGDNKQEQAAKLYWEKVKAAYEKREESE